MPLSCTSIMPLSCTSRMPLSCRSPDRKLATTLIDRKHLTPGGVFYLDGSISRAGRKRFKRNVYQFSLQCSTWRFVLISSSRLLRSNFPDRRPPRGGRGSYDQHVGLFLQKTTCTSQASYHSSQPCSLVEVVTILRKAINIAFLEKNHKIYRRHARYNV